MKTIRLLSCAFAVLILTSVSSHARGRGDSQGSAPRGGHGGEQQGKTGDGKLQLSTGLDAATSVDSSSLGPRMTDDEWRKRFLIKAAAGQK